jgi:hypothetical protein
LLWEFLILDQRGGVVKVAHHYSAIPIMAKGFYQRQMSGMVIGYEKESYS